MRLINPINNDKGSVAILCAFVFVILCVMAAFVIDYGIVVVEKDKLQNAIDATALASAHDLPDTSKATATANQYIQLNGFSPSDISINFTNSNNTINIIASKKVDYIFAKVIGLQSTTIRPICAASIQSIGGAFDYSLFSGSTTTTLNLNGSNQYVGGSSHTNDTFVANGSKITITGTCEAMNTVTVNGSQIIINRFPNSAYIEMPDFSDAIKQQAQSAGKYYTGNKTYNGSSININESIYVNGDISVNGSKFTGKGCILATGNITFNGSNLNQTSEDAVCFYSKNGNITVNGSSATFDGILYAPNGSIIMNGSSQTVNGRIIGNTVNINGSSLKIIAGSNELSSLHQGKVKLTK